MTNLLISLKLLSKDAANFLPNEPVPPVIKIDLFLNIFYYLEKSNFINL